MKPSATVCLILLQWKWKTMQIRLITGGSVSWNLRFQICLLGDEFSIQEINSRCLIAPFISAYYCCMFVLFLIPPDRQRHDTHVHNLLLGSAGSGHRSSSPTVLFPSVPGTDGGSQGLPHGGVHRSAVITVVTAPGPRGGTMRDGSKTTSCRPTSACFSVQTDQQTGASSALLEALTWRGGWL